jgi:hypothetical protein
MESIRATLGLDGDPPKKIFRHPQVLLFLPLFFWVALGYSRIAIPGLLSSWLPLIVFAST